MVESSREIDGRIERGTRLYITSLAAPAAVLGQGCSTLLDRQD